jgi:aldehyde dehydrogenase (NAD+)
MFFEPAAVDVVSDQIIGGRRIAGERAAEVVSPSSKAMVRPISWASEDQVDAAVRSARAAWKTTNWGKTGPRERAAVLMRFADLVDAHAEEICRLESLVSARIYSEAMARDVRVVSGVLRYFAEYADKVDGTVTPTPQNSLSLTVHEPYGVVAAISPWNFPMILSAWKFAPALAAGNAVVLKPSEMTPFSAARIAELAVEAGLPAGLFNVVQGDATVGAALVRHPGIDYVTFTGSSATGARIMADAAMTGLKPVSLELGGKGPQLVFDDAGEIDRLARMIARGITYNSGQVCFAGSRLVVQRGIADPLLDAVTAVMRDYRVGPTWDEATTMPPIINARQAERIDGIVQAGIADGAVALCGGAPVEHPDGAFYAPTILRGVPTDSRALREEIFGPVLAVQEFDDVDEGIALANHDDYGLTASVHTRDISRALHAARTIESGTVWINDWGRRSDFTAPFGGYKRSGLGKDMGLAGYTKYLKTKAIWVEL